jgi:hypothetical protein
MGDKYDSAEDCRRKVEVSGGYANLYDLVSRIIHSRICIASRNITFVIGHFGIGYIPKSLLEGEMSTKAIMIVESDNFEKSLCTIQDFIDAAYKLTPSRRMTPAPPSI